MYATVPSTTGPVPARVAVTAPRSSPSGSAASFAMPKSSSFAAPRVVMKMFSGLMSRWTIPFACAASSASASSIAVSTSRRHGRPRPGQPRPQRLALEQLHHEEERPLMIPDIVQGADVRMVEAGDGLRLALETARVGPGRR